MSQHTLTSEEMRPYVDRVLQHPLNWMVHSMALLFRCRLEYGNYMTQQRATFQMQALVDQHTNELTMLQNNDQIIEDSAPVQERLQFAHLLEFPLRWELQRELGRCWVKMGGVKSAMEIFTSLYMWSDVVSCLMALKKKKRAETLLRQLLSKFSSVARRLPGVSVAFVDAQQLARLLHPFDDWPVIYGQGTLALEIYEQAIVHANTQVSSLVVPSFGRSKYSATFFKWACVRGLLRPRRPCSVVMRPTPLARPPAVALRGDSLPPSAAPSFEFKRLVVSSLPFRRWSRPGLRPRRRLQ